MNCKQQKIYYWFKYERKKEVFFFKRICINLLGFLQKNKKISKIKSQKTLTENSANISVSTHHHKEIEIKPMIPSCLSGSLHYSTLNMNSANFIHNLWMANEIVARIKGYQQVMEYFQMIQRQMMKNRTIFQIN